MAFATKSAWLPEETTLQDLAVRYPLSPRWSAPVALVETVQVGDIGVRIAGIRVEDEAGQVAMGSAADLEQSPLERAYFELLERIGIVESSAEKGAPLKDSAGTEVGRARAPDVSSDPDRWRYSKSNGVAAGSSWEMACRRAEWELIERDRVLRSWYGQGRPERTTLSSRVPEAWSEFYSFEAYVFGAAASSEVVVSGVFGFPKRKAAPLLYGFGARATSSDAVAAATSECIQRLGFLWGEEIPEREPEFAPTPDYHQEFYLWPATHVRLRRWLDGAHQKRHGARSLAGPRSDRHFADITPTALGSSFFVAKALPRDELPLVFGDGHPSLGNLAFSLGIHPIS